MGRRRRTLSVDQVKRLAAMVGDGLAGFRDPLVRAPAPREYRVDTHLVMREWFDLSVDVDIGTTVLTLRMPSAEASFGRGADLNALAKRVVEHVILARCDREGLACVRAAEVTLAARIRRDRSGLELESVRFEPAMWNAPQPLGGRKLLVGVRMLDDTLLPYTQVLAGGTARAICRDLGHYGERHRRRMAVLERLAGEGALFEVASTAEQAIIAAGFGVDQVARAMVAGRMPGVGWGRAVALWGEEHWSVAVCLRDGRIILEAELPDLSWTHDRGLIVRRDLPETVVAALVGRPLCALFEHPLLPGDVEILGAERCGSSHASLILKDTARPIFPDEIDGGTHRAA